MDIFDALIAPFYLVLVLFFAYKYKAKHQHEHEAYKYFLPGLLVKIFGAIALGLIYFFYYSGGDTVNYYNTACAFTDIFYTNFQDFIHLYFGEPFKSEYYLLKGNLDFKGREEFIYWINDNYAYFASKIFFPFVMLGFKNYMASCILVAATGYMAIWKLYLVFVNEFPKIYRQFAIAILFIPSVTFWGSGILKDSITLSAACLYVYAFYWFAIQKKYKVVFVFHIFLSTFLLLSIKPYIFFALMPGSILWFVATKVANIKNGFIKILIGPLVLVVGGSLIFYVITNLSSSLGKYAIDKVFDTAQNAQQDLKRSYYMGNTFDVGDYDASLSGLLSVSHKAIFAALFRPTFLDVRNIIMAISALENTFLLGFCIFLLIKLKVYKFFLLVRSHPLALFSMIFALFFALSVGVSISNFGTLVRLKIPCIPFFISSLFIINHLMREKQLG